MQRGIKGSEARHITTQEFYRNAIAQKENLQEDIKKLLQFEDAKRGAVNELARREQEARILAEQANAAKQQTEAELHAKQTALKNVKSELKTEKFKGAAADMGSSLIDGMSSALGTSKVKRQQAEIEVLKVENDDLKLQLENKNKQIQRLYKNYQAETEQMKQVHGIELASKQNQIDRISFWFPDVPQLAKTADYCQSVGFSHEQTKQLILNRPVEFTGKLKSPKTGRCYNADMVTARIERLSGKSELILTINKMPIIKWFKYMYDELLKKRSIGRGRNQNAGPKMG